MGLDALRAAIIGLMLRPDADELKEAFALIDMLRARVAGSVAEFDALKMWEFDGATSMRAWLRHYTRRSGREAQRIAVTARCLAQLPALSKAVAIGAVSWAQVEIVVDTLGEKLIAAFVPLESTTTETLLELDLEQTAILMTRIKAQLQDEPEPGGEPPDRFHLSSTFAGRHVGDLDLSAEMGARLAAALRLATTSDAPGEPARTPAERRAHALSDIVDEYMVHHRDKAAGRNRPHISIVIDADTAGHAGGVGGHIIDTGQVLSPSEVETLLCDCRMARVMRSGSQLLDLGLDVYSIPVALRRALEVRDAHCRFPGCDRPASWCEGHHVVWFSRHGPTALNNLVLLCRRHHSLLHKPGWAARLDDDAILEITDPRGHIQVSHPPWWHPRLVA